MTRSIKGSKETFASDGIFTSFQLLKVSDIHSLKFRLLLLLLLLLLPHQYYYHNHYCCSNTDKASNDIPVEDGSTSSSCPKWAKYRDYLIMLCQVEDDAMVLIRHCDV